MKRLFNWYGKFSKQTQSSFLYSISIMGLISTVFTILGVSLANMGVVKIWMRILIVFIVYILIFVFSYLIIGRIYRDSINLTIHNTKVKISYGDIFDVSAWRVIDCDTHFSTTVDDTIISKNSLHGQLVLEHGNKFEIDSLVQKEAENRDMHRNSDGSYDFPLGTIIRYDSSVDDKTYLLLAATELDEQNESHTDMAKFEQMLMTMWKEINRVYASNNVALPLLGSGITRFDNSLKSTDALLRCILCTLNNSMLQFNAEIEIVLYEDMKDKEELSLYEYKNMF